jgi:hypothetical protein
MSVAFSVFVLCGAGTAGLKRCATQSLKVEGRKSTSTAADRSVRPTFFG